MNKNRLIILLEKVNNYYFLLLFYFKFDFLIIYNKFNGFVITLVVIASLNNFRATK